MELLPRVITSLVWVAIAAFFFVGAYAQSPEVCLPDNCPFLPFVCDQGSVYTKECAAASNDVIQGALDEVVSLLKNYTLQLESSGGFFVGVVYKGEVLLSQGVGVATIAQPNTPPTADNIFRLGSITKLFTALLMFQLRDSGQLPSFDRDVKDYLPDLNINNPFSFPISTTFKQLACHLSGVPREPPCSDYLSECNVTTAEMLELVSKANYTLLFPPFTRPAYSNFGYSILGRTLEALANETYEDLVTEQILNRLGMNSSFFVVPEEFSHLLASGTATTEPSYLGWEAPAGQLYSSGNDMIAFLQFLLDTTSSEQHSSVLSQQSLREWLTPVFTLPDGASAYGLPWEMSYSLFNLSNPSRGGLWWKTKSGQVDYFNAEIVAVPELQLGVVVLANLNVAADVATQIMNILSPVALDVIETVNNQIVPEYPSNLALLQGWYNNTFPINAKIAIKTTEASIQTLIYTEQIELPINLTWQPDASNSTYLVFQIQLPSNLPISCLLVTETAWDYNNLVFILSDSQVVQGLMFPELLPSIFFPYSPLNL